MEIFDEIGQKCPFLFQPDASSPRRRFVRLNELEAPKSPDSTSPRQGLLRLGKPKVLFLFMSSVNSINHQLE